MAETVRIEIPIETIDNTDPELSNVTRNFEKMEEAAQSANGAAKKANNTVSQFDRQAGRHRNVWPAGQKKSMRSFWRQRTG